jgi:hypothetical protein
MPVKRRASKQLRHRITPEAVVAFRAALELRAHREEQIGNSASCPGADRCELCKTYERHVAVIGQHTGAEPWGFSPIDVADCPPPPWFDPQAAQAWETARRVYCALCDAAGIERATGAAISDVTRSHVAIRWIERFPKIPEGSNTTGAVATVPARDRAGHLRQRLWQRRARYPPRYRCRVSQFDPDPLAAVANSREAP